MNYLLPSILLEFLFLQSCVGHHHHAPGKERGKRVWEFGKDVPRSYIIKNEEGTVDKRVTVLEFPVPHCHEVVYVRVEVFNPVSTPKVTSNLKRAIIKYNQGQIIDSTYKIIVKTDKKCDFRCTGNDCKYKADHKNEYMEEHKIVKESESMYQERGRTVAEFGTDLPQNVVFLDSMGTIARESMGMDIHVKGPSCQQVTYVRVEVVNSVFNPKVTTDYKVVSITYDSRQNLHSSTYKVTIKGTNNCNYDFRGTFSEEDNSADIYKI